MKEEVINETVPQKHFGPQLDQMDLVIIRIMKQERERDHHYNNDKHFSSQGKVKEDVINKTLPQKHFRPQLDQMDQIII